MKNTFIVIMVFVGMFGFRGAGAEVDTCSLGGFEFSNITGKRCRDSVPRESVIDTFNKYTKGSCLNYVNSNDISSLQDFLYYTGYYSSLSPMIKIII